MISEYYKKYFLHWIAFYFVGDMLAILTAWLTSYLARFYADFPPFSWFPSQGYESEYYLWGLPFVLFISAGCCLLTGMYRTKRLHRFSVGLTTIAKCIALINIAIFAVLFFYREYSYSRMFAVNFVVFSFLFIYLYRWVLNIFYVDYIRRHPVRRRILVVGSGETARNFIGRVGHGELGHFHVAGIILSSSEAPSFEAVQGKVPKIGRIEDIPAMIASEKIEEVFIALDADRLNLQREINAMLVNEPVDLNFIPDLLVVLNLNMQFVDCEGIPIMVLRQSPLTGWSGLYKRAFDIAGAIGAIIVFSPVMAVLSLLVKATSKGPLLYKQERASLNGAPFYIYKFRSMRVDAENQSGAVWATKNDDRTTSIGAFMRRTSLDELPQFFNVLKGDMSLVGPRPERPVFFDEFRRKIPNYMLRHKVKGGITGWAQVNGWRGNTSLEKRIEHDIFYIMHWSLWLDVKILLMTVFKGFRNENAY